MSEDELRTLIDEYLDNLKLHPPKSNVDYLLRREDLLFRIIRRYVKTVPKMKQLQRVWLGDLKPLEDE